jgi:hypothetical protein
MGMSGTHALNLFKRLAYLEGTGLSLRDDSVFTWVDPSGFVRQTPTGIQVWLKSKSDTSYYSYYHQFQIVTDATTRYAFADRWEQFKEMPARDAVRQLCDEDGNFLDPGSKIWCEEALRLIDEYTRTQESVNESANLLDGFAYVIQKIGAVGMPEPDSYYGSVTVDPESIIQGFAQAGEPSQSYVLPLETIHDWIGQWYKLGKRKREEDEDATDGAETSKPKRQRRAK